MFALKHLPLALGCVLAAQAHASMNIQPDPQNPNGYVIARGDIQAMEQSKTSDPMYAIWSQALETRPNTVVEAIIPGAASNPENVKRVERVFPESEWNFLTQMAAPEYTYTRFLRAIGKFPAFCGEYTDGRDSDAICKKSIVTAFAHFAQEPVVTLRLITYRTTRLHWKSGNKHWFTCVKWDGLKVKKVTPQAVVRTIGKISVGLVNLVRGISVVVQNSFLTTLTTALSLK